MFSRLYVTFSFSICSVRSVFRRDTWFSSCVYCYTSMRFAVVFFFPFFSGGRGGGGGGFISCCWVCFVVVVFFLLFCSFVIWFAWPCLCSHVLGFKQQLLQHEIYPSWGKVWPPPLRGGGVGVEKSDFFVGGPINIFGCRTICLSLFCCFLFRRFVCRGVGGTGSHFLSGGGLSSASSTSLLFSSLGRYGCAEAFV